MALLFQRSASRRCFRGLNGSWLRSFSASQRPQQAQTVDFPEHETAGGDGPAIRKHYRRYKTEENDGSLIRKHSLANDSFRRFIDIDIDGKCHSWSPIFLRDLCTCPRCVDQSTRQKHFWTAEIPSTISAEVTHPNPDAIRLHWRGDIAGFEGHETDLSLDLLRSLRTSGTTKIRPRLPRNLWSAADYSEEAFDVDYETYMNDESVLLKVLRQLHTHGMVFVTNVPESEQSVQTLGERIGPLKTTFYGKTWDVRSVPDAINVAYTAQNLGFHMDLMYMKQPPHLQLLHCIRSSAAGGASLFTDSFKAATYLAAKDPEAWRHLTTLPVDFHYDHPGSQYYHQHRTVIEEQPFMIGERLYQNYSDFRSHRESRYGAESAMEKSSAAAHFIDNISWAPMFQGPFSLPHRDQSTASEKYEDSNVKRLNIQVEQWQQAASKFNQLIHRSENIYERMMNPGDCVIFDNRRVLHARRAFDVGDIGKERWLRGAYLDKDPYMSRLTTLSDRDAAISAEFGVERYFENAAKAEAA